MEFVVNEVSGVQGATETGGSILALLWNEFNLHTFIEILAILLASLIVHPLISLVKRIYVLQRRAASSKVKAVARTKKILHRYAQTRDKLEAFKANNLMALVISASENLRIIFIFLFAM